MFDRSAQLYDLIYGQFKDYPAEAAAVVRMSRTEVDGLACPAAAGLDTRHDPVGLTERGPFVARAAG